jgi:Sec-independent protein translocase protein TatA
LEFLQTLLIILLVLVGTRLLWKAFGKMFLKWLGMKALQRVQNSFEKRAGSQEGQNPFQNTSSRQSTNAKSSTPLKSNEKKKVGEYIDFEEID